MFSKPFLTINAQYTERRRELVISGGKSVTIPEGLTYIAMCSRIIKHGICGILDIDKMNLKQFYDSLLICDWQDYMDGLVGNNMERL